MSAVHNKRYVLQGEKAKTSTQMMPFTEACLVHKLWPMKSVPFVVQKILYNLFSVKSSEMSCVALPLFLTYFQKNVINFVKMSFLKTKNIANLKKLVFLETRLLNAFYTKTRLSKDLLLDMGLLKRCNSCNVRYEKCYRSQKQKIFFKKIVRKIERHIYYLCRRKLLQV